MEREYFELSTLMIPLRIFHLEWMTLTLYQGILSMIFWYLKYFSILGANVSGLAPLDYCHVGTPVYLRVVPNSHFPDTIPGWPVDSWTEMFGLWWAHFSVRLALPNIADWINGWFEVNESLKAWSMHTPPPPLDLTRF